ncbi:hypothetical protein HY464_03040 [Candidatus Peregrinibacteria bacterium]|nr:hypothetical protein [Candidatus Peregrinibacteria bacterium]
MGRKGKESQEYIEHLPLFDGPIDRELFRHLVTLGILTEEEERKNWFRDVPRGEDGIKILNFEEFIASNRQWYLWLLLLHNEGKTATDIQKIAEERAINNIRSLRKQLGNSPH